MLQAVGFSRVENVNTWLDDGSRKKGTAIFHAWRDTDHSPDSRTPNHLRAALALDRERVTCAPGDSVHFTVGLENTGRATWLAAGDGRSETGVVRLGGHLYAEEVEIIWDYGRADLPGDIRAGDTVELEIEMRAPIAPGIYRIDFDMVAEHITWFKDLGSPIASAVLVVEPRTSQ